MKKLSLILLVFALALMWVSIPVIAHAQTTLFPDGVYTIRCKEGGLSYVMDVCNAADKNKTPVWLYASNGTNAQKWRLVNLGNNVIELYPLSSSNGYGRVLDVTDGKLDIYTPMPKWANHQRFYLQKRSDGYCTIALANNRARVAEALSISLGGKIVMGKYKSWASQHWRFDSVDMGTTPPPTTTTYFNPVWPVPGEYCVSTLTKYSNGKTHGTLWKRPLQAIDIAAPKGTPVVAVEAGIVVNARYSNPGASDFGYNIRIVHDDGDTESFYAHFNVKPMVAVGDRVKKGQVIGVVGSTGKSTGPHLHFELSGHNPYIEYYKDNLPLVFILGAKKYGQS